VEVDFGSNPKLRSRLVPPVDLEWPALRAIWSLQMQSQRTQYRQAQAVSLLALLAHVNVSSREASPQGSDVLYYFCLFFPKRPEQTTRTKSEAQRRNKLEPGYNAARHARLQTAICALTPVSGPPQIQVVRSVPTKPNVRAVAYAPPSDSAHLFPGAPHALSGAGGCVMVCKVAVTCRKSFLVTCFV